MHSSIYSKNKKGVIHRPKNRRHTHRPTRNLSRRRLHNIHRLARISRRRPVAAVQVQAAVADVADVADVPVQAAVAAEPVILHLPANTVTWKRYLRRKRRDLYQQQEHADGILALAFSFENMLPKHDFSIFDVSLADMMSKPFLSNANRSDCVISCMYSVGLLDYQSADAGALQITQQGLVAGLPYAFFTHVLSSILNSDVQWIPFQQPPFEKIERHNILEDGEAMLLFYARTDGSGHMVILGKNNGRLYICETQAHMRRCETIEEFLARDSTIHTFCLCKIKPRSPLRMEMDAHGSRAGVEAASSFAAVSELRWQEAVRSFMDAREGPSASAASASAQVELLVDEDED